MMENIQVENQSIDILISFPTKNVTNMTRYFYQVLVIYTTPIPFVFANISFHRSGSLDNESNDYLIFILAGWSLPESASLILQLYCWANDGHGWDSQD